MASESCLYLIHSLQVTGCSEKEKVVANYILANPASSVHPSIEELASNIGVSISTLLRFVKKLGYSGYQQFRIALATEALAPEARIYETPVETSDDPVSIVFGAAMKALDMTRMLIDRASLAAFAEAACKTRNLYIFGIGGSGVVAQDAFHKLMRSGLTCQTAEDYHFQLMLASQSGPKDIALLISHTGANKDALAIAETLRKTGCRLAAITTYPRSALAKMADILFLAAAPGASIISEAFSARIAHLAIIDSLYVAIMEVLKKRGLAQVDKMRGVIATRRI
jgi:DNA-binding MurR/RpiR family transcriptional regulator